MLRWTSSVLLLTAAAVSALILLRVLAPTVGTETDAIEVAPGILIEPSLLDFGRLPVGGSREELVVATNRGAEPVRIEARADDPYHASRRALMLEPGEAREISVRFTPRESGLIEAALRLDSEAFEDGPFELPLLGVAHEPPQIAVTPLSLDFGAVAVEGSSEAVFTIENRGEGELALGQIGAPAPFELLVPEARLAPGESRRLSVRFKPTSAGEQGARFAILSNDPKQGRVFVSLAGEGVEGTPVPVAEVAPLGVDFGEVRVGGERQRWFQLRNAGSDPLQVTSVAITPPFSGSTRSRSLHPGQSVVFPVTYRPGDDGLHQGRVQLYSNDPAHPRLEVLLRGQGSHTLDVSDDGGTRAAGPLFGEDGSLPEESPLDDPGYEPDPVADGSVVAVGTYTAGVDDFHIESVTFDPSASTLSLDGVQLPTVEAALGEYFEFGETSWSGRVSPLGEVSGELLVPVTDRSGRTTHLRVPLTTGTTTVNHGGTVFSFEGRPFSIDGTALLTGAATFESGTAKGRTFEILLDVQATLPE